MSHCAFIMVKCLEQYELRRLLSDIDCRYRKIKCCLTQLAHKSVLPELFHNVKQAPTGRDPSIQWVPLCGENAGGKKKKKKKSRYLDLCGFRVLKVS